VAASRRLKVLIVDDSASVRQALSDMIGAEPDLEVMGTAADPYFAAQKIQQEIPDVILCDVEMPRMDGITFVQKIMSQRPIPVIICSSLTTAGSATFMRAMEAGAVDVVTKPQLGTREFLNESRVRITDAIRAAATARIRQRSANPAVPQAKLTADAIIPPPRRTTLVHTTERVVMIGASTGGTEALRAVLEALPPDVPGILVVQHMPAGFTSSFANRLNELCRVSVREARHGDRVLRGQVLIAPGDKHLLVQRSGAQYRVEVREGPLVSRHRPSVDVLFRSAARAAGPNATGIIMTGMGDDGAKGLLEMRQSGGATIAQDEESCVVFGMPKEAIRLGAAQHILPLGRLADEIVRYT
jgi:two-component system chemotaxis response regulator CheB